MILKFFGASGKLKFSTAAVACPSLLDSLSQVQKVNNGKPFFFLNLTPRLIENRQTHAWVQLAHPPFPSPNLMGLGPYPPAYHLAHRTLSDSWCSLHQVLVADAGGLSHISSEVGRVCGTLVGGSHQQTQHQHSWVGHISNGPAPHGKRTRVTF